MSHVYCIRLQINLFYLSCWFQCTFLRKATIQLADLPVIMLSAEDPDARWLQFIDCGASSSMPPQAQQGCTFDQYCKKGHRNKNLTLPPRGQPGGLDDPYRRNMCGSRIKWYLRYLQQGLSPSDALVRSCSRPTSKLPRLGLVKPKPMIEKSDSKSNETIAKNYKVAVLPVNYPREKLNHEDLSALEEAILDEIIYSPCATAVAFAGIHFRIGHLVIECVNENSAKWLRNTASNLHSWTGVPLEARTGNDIPSPHTMTIFCPRSKDRLTPAILQLLKNQNNLDTHTWRVISRRNEGGGALLVIGIDEEFKEAIAAKGHTLNFRFGTIPVNGLKNKEKAANQSSERSEPDEEDVGIYPPRAPS